jgi:O-antigen ligase
MLDPTVILAITGLAVAAVWCVVGLLRTRRSGNRNWLLAAPLWIAALGTLALAMQQRPGVVSATPSGPWGRVSQLVPLVSLALGVIAVLSRTRTPIQQARRSRRLLLAAFAVVAATVLAGIGATVPSIDRNLLIWLVLLLGLAAHPPSDPAVVVQHLRWILRVFSYGSLIQLVVAPTAAVFPDNSPYGQLGVMDDRLQGLAGHPNGLGALSATALLVELARVGRRRLWWLHAAAAAVTLLLSESRTSWAAAAAGMVLLATANLSTPKRVAGLTTLAATLLAVQLSPLGQQPQISWDPEVGTVHGRTSGWRAATAGFSDNPVFGYGPSLLSTAYQEQYYTYELGGAFGGAERGNAHNQLFQTIGATGLIGTIALFLYIAALVAAARRTHRPTRGLSIALVGILLVRSFSEVPLQPSGLNLLHLATLMTVVASLQISEAGPVDGVVDSTPASVAPVAT